MNNYLHILHKVLDTAQKLIYVDESPFAAALWVNGQIYLAGNQSRTQNNPNFHAEIVCINEFCRLHNYQSLDKAIMFSSCEPCLMCFHSIYNSGIRHIVYAASIDDAIRYGSGDEPIHISEYATQMNMDIKIEGPFLRERVCDIFEECISFRGEL